MPDDHSPAAIAPEALAVIDPATAQLPANYEAAKVALAECDRVDECKDWADQAAALASYARQSNNDEMAKMCRRIQGRAVRRVQELLREIPPAANQHEVAGGDSPTGRMQAAREAGLSKDQYVAVMRVGNIPDEEFEAAIESDDPPTVTALAERGRRERAERAAAIYAAITGGTFKQEPLIDLGGRSPEDFAEATKLMGLVTRFVTDSQPLDIPAAMRGLTVEERHDLLTRIELAMHWLGGVAAEAMRL